MSPSEAPSPATGSQLWSPFVLALAGTICTIFMLSSYYWVLKGHCRTFHGMTFFSGNQTVQLLNEDNPENPSLQFQSRGLDSYIMHALPITQFKRKNGGEELGGQGNRDCAVCLGQYEEGEWVKHLPNCSHSFHVSCIDTWFQAHSSCPLCRSYVHDLAIMQNEDSVSMYTLLETMMRDEDFINDRSAQSEVIHSPIPLNSLPAIDP